jgi:hypothetical protein
VKYVISFDTEFGCVSAESEDPDDLFSAYSKLQGVAVQLSKKNQKGKRQNKIARNSVKSSASSTRVPETTAVLRELESNVLSSKFFSEPRTTGETREKIRELSGKSFASRKVSQALGILKDRGKLKRKGTRNFYQYSLS